MEKIIPLWEGDVPLLDESIDQPRPSVRFFPVNEKGRGAVIVCPGGGYAHKAEHEGAPIARFLNSCGINAFVLDYRVSPYRYPAMLLDAQRAIRLVRYHAANWGYDPNHIGILGFSAGGHLTTMAATHYDPGDKAAADPIDRVSCRPDAFIPCYAVCSFVQFPHLGSMRNATGKDQLPPAESRYYSAECNVTGDTPPAFLWHTAQDAGVPVENSLNLALALSAHAVPFALHVFPFGRHGLGLAQEEKLAAQWPQLLREWLVDFGY